MGGLGNSVGGPSNRATTYFPTMAARVDVPDHLQSLRACHTPHFCSSTGLECGGTLLCPVPGIPKREDVSILKIRSGIEMD